MIFYKHKNMFFALALMITFSNTIFCRIDKIAGEELVIVGGGIAGGMEAYYAFMDAKKNKIPLHLTIYEKNNAISETTVSNIVPSLTCDEILAFIPSGSKLVKQLEVPFNKPGGIRVDDVIGIHGTSATEEFTQAVQIYSLDEQGHVQRTQDLLALGKMSMDMWQEMYNNADAEFKAILDSSNFNPCREPLQNGSKILHDGYRIALIYKVQNAQRRAESMINDYIALGYKHCTILTPAEVIAIDPSLKHFCESHSIDNIWNNDTVALWRPGGFIDAQFFLPKLYEYLKNFMGNRFQINYGKKVTALVFAKDAAEKTVIAGLKFADGETIIKDTAVCQFIFCPGEAVGTLKKLGLCEPAYAGFAGVSLLLDIEIPQDKLKDFAKFNHCMDVHQEGISLAWQARFRNNKIFIGVAGTKSFYSDQQPTKDQEFAKDRNLLQLNMINDVLPEFISLALKYDTKGKTLTEKDLNYLESQGIAKRWAGVRAVVYDGFPTVGYVYKQDGSRVENARCTTHLGSGGGSFSPAATVMSRNAMNKEHDAFTKRILKYGNSSRTARSE